MASRSEGVWSSLWGRTPGAEVGEKDAGVGEGDVGVGEGAAVVGEDAGVEEGAGVGEEDAGVGEGDVGVGEGAAVVGEEDTGVGEDAAGGGQGGSERARTGPTPAASAASEAVTTAVLGNDDLLREILLRLGFPTTLVCAALVSKRWLRHASDPAFLRLFRARHQPALLGFYVNGYSRTEEPTPPQFVAITQAPELATAVRRASFPDDDVWECVVDCRNGRGIVMSPSALWPSSPFAAIDLLHQTRGAARFPPPLPYPYQEEDGIFPPVPEDGGVPPPLPYPEGEDDGNILPAPLDGRDGRDGMVAVKVIYGYTRTMVYAEVYTYQPCYCEEEWTVRTVPEIQLPEPSSAIPNPDPSNLVMDTLPPVNGKIYMATNNGYILVLDLASTSICAIKIPNRVRTTNFKLLCREEDARLFVIHADGFQLSIWHHKADGNGANTWVLVHDRIIVHEACNRHDDVFVMAADNNLEYMFLWLEASRLLMHIHLKSRSEKVYDELNVYDESTLDRSYLHIKPFVMVWPPVFPALRGEDNLEV
ncbi:unnamed protein product [Miscanthus lutarioriparius]|uniref:F-box domain-containing protein n=1 Tax=Miscanthus lutarioriparius TaxID=422564 RepID=A0A811PUV7_9POAL|nr:unnamed protein product [Miscanthus lutarioriparius]